MGFVDPAQTPIVDAMPNEQTAALQHVLRRALAEGWTRTETMEVLQALGLIPGKSGGKYDPTTGSRISDSRRNRRKAS